MARWRRAVITRQNINLSFIANRLLRIYWKKNCVVSKVPPMRHQLCLFFPDEFCFRSQLVSHKPFYAKRIHMLSPFFFVCVSTVCVCRYFRKSIIHIVTYCIQFPLRARVYHTTFLPVHLTVCIALNMLHSIYLHEIMLSSSYAMSPCQNIIIITTFFHYFRCNVV